VNRSEAAHTSRAPGFSGALSFPIEQATPACISNEASIELDQ
jgi:hypothetical protein